MLRRLPVPRLGGVRLSEPTTDRIDAVLAELGQESLNRQRKAKVVMGAMLDAAVERGATANPVRGSLSINKPISHTRSLTGAEVEAVRAAIRAWLGKERSGPKSSGDLADIIEVMLATGARIGEVLALRWADIDLTMKVVEISATIKTESGVGTYRKPLPRPRGLAAPVPTPFHAGRLPRRRLSHSQRDVAAGQQRRAALAADSPRGRAGMGHHRDASPECTGRWAQSRLRS